MTAPPRIKGRRCYVPWSEFGRMALDRHRRQDGDDCDDGLHADVHLAGDERHAIRAVIIVRCGERFVASYRPILSDYDGQPYLRPIRRTEIAA